LKILESEKLITPKWDTEKIGPAKKIYSITPEERKMLSKWVGNNCKRKFLRFSLDDIIPVYK